MNETFDDTAALYLLDELAAPARAAFEAQVQADPALAARWRELESGFEAGIRALPQRPPPARSWSRLAASLDERAARPAAPFLRWAWAGLGVAAAVLAAVGTLAFREIRHPAAGAAAELVVADLGQAGGSVEYSRLPGAPDSDERFHELAVRAREYWEEAPSTPRGAANRVYALFDPGAHEGFLGVRHLQPPGAGHEYHLWIVDTATDEAADAGELPIDGAERGLFHFTVAPKRTGGAGPLDFIVTTEEQTAGPLTKPAGTVVVASNPTKAF
jgi:hypothetical protein